jgi:hypothetical protein
VSGKSGFGNPDFGKLSGSIRVCRQIRQDSLANLPLGRMLRDDFNLDTHRWRRFLVAMARMEETLDETAKAYAGPPGEPFAAFLARYPGTKPPYAQSPGEFAEMVKRGQELADTGVAWRAPPTVRGGHIPQPPTDLRITPKP